MQICTRPIPSPKSPFPSRAEALQDGRIVDLQELTACSPRTLLGLPCALSHAVLQRVEEIPFGLLGSSSVERRLGELVRSADLALRRAREVHGQSLHEGMRLGFAMDFAVRLPRRAAERTVGFVRLHCGPDEDGRTVLTLLEPEELVLEAREGTCS